MVYDGSYLYTASLLRKLPILARDNRHEAPNNGKNETAAHNQNPGQTRRNKTNTKREPTLRTSVTTATRGDKNQHRTRTSEKGKRNHLERGGSQSKGETKDQTATNPNP